jgi:hypothetical protein
MKDTDPTKNLNYQKLLNETRSSFKNVFLLQLDCIP